MARGDSGDGVLFTLKRVMKKEKNWKRASHEEALELLNLDDNGRILTKDEINYELDLLGETIFSVSEFMDDQEHLEFELKSLFPAERDLLHKGASDLELLFLAENILLKKLNEGLITEQEIAEMKKTLPDKDWSNREILLLSFLRRSLPLLRLSGQSMESLRGKLGDRLDLEIAKTADEDIFAAICQSEGRTRAEREEGISDTLLLIQSVAASRNHPGVLETERIVRDNFLWAKERSEVANRLVKHLPLVAEATTLAWLGFPDAPYPPPQGVAACCLPGHGGVEATLIAAANLDKVDEEEIKRVMVHEMIHDTQEGSLITGDKEHDLFYVYTFNEALTEGLAFLRAKEKESLMHKPAYTAEVLALYQILSEAKIKDSDYHDFLTYLNSITAEEALDLLAERLKKNREDTKNHFRRLSQQANGIGIKLKDHHLIKNLQKIFNANTPFP
jgi:hypothetical protein